MIYELQTNDGCFKHGDDGEIYTNSFLCFDIRENGEIFYGDEKSTWRLPLIFKRQK